MPGGFDSGWSPAFDTAWYLKTNQFGHAGSVLAVLTADGEIYFGLIRGNDDKNLQVTWLEGRQPPAGPVRVGLGICGSYADSAWLRLSDGMDAAVLRWLNLFSAAGRADARVTVLGTDNPGDPSYAEAARATREVRDLMLGEGARQNQAYFDVRGQRHQIRLAVLSLKPMWEVGEIGVAYHPTKGS